MTRQEQITMLSQVGPVAEVNSKLLKLAATVPLSEGKRISDAVKKMIEACDIINQLGAEYQETETANPKLN